MKLLLAFILSSIFTVCAFGEGKCAVGEGVAGCKTEESCKAALATATWNNGICSVPGETTTDPCKEVTDIKVIKPSANDEKPSKEETQKK